MSVPEYPKIETLFDRDEQTRKVLVGRYRLPEFANVKRWYVTEKIDGTNVRVALVDAGDDFTTAPKVWIGGRTDNAQMPPHLLAYLTETFPVETLLGLFPVGDDGEVPRVVLYGEGYGPKIQKGGGRYRADPAFRLFDVLINGVWLEPESVEDIAYKLGIKHAPALGVFDGDDDLIHMLRDYRDTFRSRVAGDDGGDPDLLAEGIVARSYPLMLRRYNGERVMWKLKTRDF